MFWKARFASIKHIINLGKGSDVDIGHYFLNDKYPAKGSLLFKTCTLQAMCDASNINKYLSQVEGNENRKEIVMFGRSNVGKSSLINQLFHGLQAAYTSNKPGKTQQLFFFRLDAGQNKYYIVDSPGYGFASEASKQQMESWKFMINAYLKSPFLHRAICLFDCQHGVKKLDQMLMKMLDSKMRPYLLVGTKCDKKMPKEEQLKDYLDKHPMINSFVHLTSCKQKTGINELRSHLAYIFDQDMMRPPS